MKTEVKKGRPREFDTSQALDKALLVFWEKGYRGTSLDDLTSAMEINKPSLYAAFGDKEKLFLASIDQYIATYIVPPLRKLVTGDNGQKDLRHRLMEYFRSMANVIVNEKTPPGCLIACMLSEECCESPVIKQRLSAAIEAADATFQKLFEKHKDELQEGLSASAASKLMTTFNHGISIRARAGADKQALGRIAENFAGVLLRD